MEAMTIVISNHNKGRYLQETLDSLVRQEDSNWYALVMDDGSSDDSRSILQPYAGGAHPRIAVFFNQEQQGKARCMNRLVALAPTDIIGELDSDDVLAPDCVAAVLNAYRESDSGFVYTNFTYCTPDLTPMGKGYCAAIPEGRTALELNCVSAFRTFRKSALARTAGFDEGLASAIDKDLVYKLEEVTLPYFVDRQLYLYRMLRDSLSRGGDRLRQAEQNHEIVKARALARRNGDPRAVRRTAR